MGKVDKNEKNSAKGTCQVKVERKNGEGQLIKQKLFWIKKKKRGSGNGQRDS